MSVSGEEIRQKVENAVRSYLERLANKIPSKEHEKIIQGASKLSGKLAFGVTVFGLGILALSVGSRAVSGGVEVIEYEDQGKFEEAIPYTEEAIWTVRNSEQKYYFHQRLANLQERAGQLEKAELTYQDMINTFEGSDSDKWYNVSWRLIKFYIDNKMDDKIEPSIERWMQGINNEYEKLPAYILQIEYELNNNNYAKTAELIDKAENLSKEYLTLGEEEQKQIGHNQKIRAAVNILDFYKASIKVAGRK